MPKRGMNYCFRQEAAAEGGTKHMLYIYDSVRKYGKFNWQTWQYEDAETSAKRFRDLLDEIPDGESIELHVNSVGGEVGEGVTIFNLLKQKQDRGSKITAYVDGMAYSVAMDIVLAAKEVHMGLGTTMFLHNPWLTCSGNAAQLRGYADQLDAMTDASVQLYLSRSAGKVGEAELRDMMEKETMLDPQKCVEYGFCDVIDDFKAQEDNEDEDKDEIIQELRNQLFRQQEVNRMMQFAGFVPAKQEAPPAENEAEKRAKVMRETMAAAMKTIAG